MLDQGEGAIWIPVSDRTLTHSHTLQGLARRRWVTLPVRGRPLARFDRSCEVTDPAEGRTPGRRSKGELKMTNTSSAENEARVGALA
jgi:hypothetical protein